MRLLAPAKINLRLEVLGRLPNGYHQLRMFNITVGLYDQIDLEFTEKGLSIDLEDLSIPSDHTNTVARAVNYFQAKFGFKFGVQLKIQKGIPSGAGLGGGSSDAAVVLKALLEKFQLDLSALNLEEVAYLVSADVPYLLYGGPAWVEGIGEKIEPVPEFPELVYLLVKPNFKSSTPEVFQALELDQDLTIEPKEVIFESVIRREWKNFCINHLEKVVFAKQPGLARLRSELLRLGVLAGVMTGSGSTLVGIFSTWEQAEKGREEILKFQPELWVQVVKQIQPTSARK